MKPALRDDFQFNVLVVDDDLTILSLLREIMEMVPGCQVTTVSNPRDAIEFVMNNRVDIVFTDIHMPNTTGLEFLEDLIRLEQTPEVIVMTAYPTGEDAQKAMDLGATSFISKPFDDIKVVELELEKSIKKVLRQRAAEKEVELRKLEISKIIPKEQDRDPPMHVSFPSLDAPSEPLHAESDVSEAVDQAATMPVNPDDTSERPTEISPPMAMSLDSGDGQLSAPALSESRSEPLQNESESSGAFQSSNGAPSEGGVDFNSLRRAEALEEIPLDEMQPTRSFYALPFLTPLVEVEIERCKRHRRQFVVGVVEMPEPPVSEDRQSFRAKQRYRFEQMIRRSDVLLELDDDRVVVVGFECNKVGAEVLERKLASTGFQHAAFAAYPGDGDSGDRLLNTARERLNLRRKLQIVLFEPDEFFGRLITNMLVDPKYHVVWIKTHHDLYQHMTMETENVRLTILNLSKDKEQWRLMARMMREGLVRWPVLLGVDATLTQDVKEKLGQLGVKAVVHRSASQEEFQYLVQSFAVPKPQNIERKNYRALVALPVSYEVKDQTLSSVTFTLSREGMFVRDMSPPGAGEIVPVKIFTPGRPQPLSMRCEVLYAIPYFIGVNRVHVPGFACRFLDLNDYGRTVLDEIVNQSLTTYLL